jgi:hypothetical protein
MTDDPVKAATGPHRPQSCQTCAAYRTTPRRCLIEHIEFYAGGRYCADYYPTQIPKESPAT